MCDFSNSNLRESTSAFPCIKSPRHILNIETILFPCGRFCEQRTKPSVSQFAKSQNNNVVASRTSAEMSYLASKWGYLAKNPVRLVEQWGINWAVANCTHKWIRKRENELREGYGAGFTLVWLQPHSESAQCQRHFIGFPWQDILLKGIYRLNKVLK